MNSNTALGNTALVLGATGGIGGEVARQLRDAGWTVRALRRGGELATERRDGMVWLRGDAMNRDDVMAAAQGLLGHRARRQPTRLSPLGRTGLADGGQHHRCRSS